MTSHELLLLLRDRLDEQQAAWLQGACSFEGERLLAAFVGAGRRLGGKPIGALPADSVFAGQVWAGRTAGRVALILSLDERLPSEAGAWIERAYREGDTREKTAVMAALPALSSGARFVEMALDAGRTNETELFSSIALANPFAARHYSEHAFNKLVMKAAFLNLDLGAIAGLTSRANPELARMGMEYIDERLAAERSYPPSLWLAIAPSNPAGATARMLGELNHSVVERRRGSAQGLSLSRDVRALPFLQERLELEKDARTTTLLETAIATLRKVDTP